VGFHRRSEKARVCVALTDKKGPALASPFIRQNCGKMTFYFYFFFLAFFFLAMIFSFSPCCRQSEKRADHPA
jgi:hypothetical protein